MTREEAIAYGKEQLEVFGGKHAEFIKLAIEALEQESCEDAVSRKEVLEMIEQIQDAGGFIGYNTYSEAFDRVDNMTLTTPTRKVGKWIDTGETNINKRGQIVHEVICSECNGISYFRSMGNKYIGANLCPNCGSRNEVEYDNR